ncbi:hypothetical protein TTHERM_01190430 (macronuclear) [Tetrahymena thermophila SB210]|uniref:Uncharacterized protein n=1 Tax=Tetrahymena thermophila (strain SB210) TaxID=312017 RepID=Q239Q2_TETTS|nr:hypothetical protein TTHERM_01190430 [Tetrahymena thermophila SB210]EAR93263.2 hypothetical protein TTHERM_01190430 [Tetrahymena thermophila SB210]|eukprot:XP_001013508.2 hypothetical protein TTHERM_01190430 [Tetrahymena thermophila SB210]
MNLSQEGVLPWQRNKHNKLLLKNEIGKAKQSTYNLPPINHVYGKPPKKDAEGAKEVTMTWKYHDESKDKEPPRDFLKLNRDCIKDKCFNAKEISRYRDSHQEVKKKIKKGKIGIELDLPNDDFRYGVRNKPSTPINQVLELHYLQEHERKLLDYYAIQRQEQKKEKKLVIKSNQASQLRSISQERLDQQKVAQNIVNDFKLERFKNIKPKIQTRSNQNLNQNHSQEEFLNQSSEHAA